MRRQPIGDAPMTRAEKRAYQRGYRRGKARDGSWAMRLLDLLKGYRARLADLETPRRCDLCSRWTRGGETTLWGMCAMSGDTSAWVTEPGAWPDHDWQDRRRRDLITHEHFGCVNWLPKGPTS